MPYPKKLLNDYETVALDLHPHWWYFVGPVIAVVGSIVIGVLSLALLGGDGLSDAARWAALVVLGLCAVWLAIRYMKWATTNFVITSDRVIFRSGVLSKRGIEIPLERVNNVSFKQSIFERMLGAGDLLIESGGEDGQQRFSDIRRPDRVQNLIHAQMGVNESRRFGGQPAGHDVVSQLEKLEGLMERGMISRDEFDEQKRRLLRS